MRRGHWEVKFKFWVEGKDNVLDLEDLSEEELNERISKIAEDYGHLLEPDKKKKEKKNGKTEE